MTHQNHTTTTAKPERMLYAGDICKHLDISRPTLYRWERLGIIPSRISYGANSNKRGLPESVFSRWYQERLATITPSTAAAAE